jgi:excisionase family DNA binding protein
VGVAELVGGVLGVVQVVLFDQPAHPLGVQHEALGVGADACSSARWSSRLSAGSPTMVGRPSTGLGGPAPAGAGRTVTTHRSVRPVTRSHLAILRVGRNQLYAAIARGELSAVRIGRTIRIPKAALADLLTTPPDPQAQAATSE